MSRRLGPDKELAALELLEQALEIQPDNPRLHIEAADCSAAVRERALRLLSASKASSVSIRTGGVADQSRTLEDEATPEQIGAYRVLGLLGRGGMGTVYRAERAGTDFDHVVAIKVIKTQLSSDAMIDRFRRERQILARLRHSHIARLYDGGETDRGAPYIVMELIDGKSLACWREQGGASLNKRLDLMTQICSAVECAHQNLVIHRDLTPGNVLVTEAGEAKLIDFGIARPQLEGAAAAPQSPLSRLSLTPGYAAPERVAGAPVTTLGDIFSLGRILSFLLEGSDVPELRAIAARACDIDPTRRYTSAALLARDIADYRSGQPVAAFSGAPGYRLRKFTRRHRVPVALGALSAVLLIGGIVTISNAYREAERARQSAETRFAEVRALSNFLLFDLYDELEDVPGTTKVLNAIADRARHYLDTLSATQGASPEVKLEAALAYKRLSDVLGTPIGPNLGRRKEAGVALKIAITQLRALRAADPGDRAVTEGLAEALYSSAVFAFIALDDNEAAHEAAGEAARLYWQLAADVAERERFAAKAIDAEIEAALPLAWIGRGTSSAAALKSTLARMEAHIAAFGPSSDNLGLLARTESALAETLGKLADSGGAEYAEALVYADRAISTYRDYIAATDKKDGASRSLAISLFKRSLTLYSLERYADALRDIAEAEAIVNGLIARDPHDRGIVRVQSAILEQKAITLAYAGRAAEGLRVARRSLSQKRAAASLEPDNPGLRRDYAANLLLVAEVAEIGGRQAEACRLYREGEQMYRELDRDNGLSDYDREELLAGLPESLARTC